MRADPFSPTIPEVKNDMICSEQSPGEVSRPRPSAPNATEEGTAKAALWLFLAGLAVAMVAGVVWGVLRLRLDGGRS